MLIATLTPHFFSALMLSVLLFAMVLEPNSNTRFLEAMTVFLLFWGSVLSYAIAHNGAVRTGKVF